MQGSHPWDTAVAVSVTVVTFGTSQNAPNAGSTISLVFLSGEYGPLGEELTISEMLEGLGVPIDQVAPVLRQLNDIINAIPAMSEAAIVIFQSTKDGTVGVDYRIAQSKNGMTTLGEQVDLMRTTAEDGGNNILAWGHAHGMGWVPWPSGSTLRDGKMAGDTYATDWICDNFPPKLADALVSRAIVLGDGVLSHYDCPNGVWNFSYTYP